MFIFRTILKNDIKIMLKDFKTILLIIFMPVFIISVFSLALSPLLNHNAFVEPFNLVLVEEDQSSWTGLLASQLKNLGIIKNVINCDEISAREYVKNQEAAAAIVIPRNLVNSIDHWEPMDGRVIGSDLLYLQSKLVKNIAFVGSTAVSSGLAALNTIYDIEVLKGYPKETINKEIDLANEAYISKVLNRKVFIKEGKLSNPDINPFVYYAMSLFSVFILFSSIPCMKLLTEERRMGILTRLNAAPTGSWETVLSKLVLSFLISSVQFIIIYSFIVIVGGEYLMASIGQVILVFIFTTLACGAFSLFIASIAGSGGSADLITNLSILLMAIVGGSLFPLAALPDACRAISVFTINRWSTEGFLNALYTDSLQMVIKSCFPLFLLAIFFFAATSITLDFRRRRV